ncbi:MAG: hypothetical protein P8126_01960 [Gammaproteobacteria bacterium]
MRRLTLFIPGLLGPAAPLADSDLPPLPALSLVLGRARRRRTRERDYHRQLCDLMGLDAAEDRDVPAAAVTRLIDGEEHPDGLWMRADPVHLSADRDRLVLIDASVFKVSQHDALAVATEVQRVLDGEGWRLEVPFPDRWYIRLDADPGVTTTDPLNAGGRDVDPCLPRGREARRMHRLLNEIQMQLHDADINREREARGDLPINSVWFWGTGALPDVPPRRWSAVYSDDVFVRGLAMLSMTPWHGLPASAAEVLDAAGEKSDLLIVLEHCRLPAQYGDLPRWGDALAELEDEWFGPLLQSLREGTIQSLTLITGNDSFHLNRPALKKFWRRPRSLSRLAAA